MSEGAKQSDGSSSNGGEASSSTSTTTGSCGSVKRSFTTQFEGIDLTTTSGNGSGITPQSASNVSSSNESITEPVDQHAVSREALRLDIGGVNSRRRSRNGLNGLKPVRPPPEPVNNDIAQAITADDNR